MRVAAPVLCALVAVAAAGHAASRPAAPDVGAVIAAERAFAARGQAVPVKQAFLDFAAPDGVLIDSDRGAENALKSIGSWPDKANAGFIKWWPIYAGISASGDFGFTTGPATYGGDKGYTHYFTVWKKQADGSWKWLIDMGAANPGPSPFGPDTPVTVAPAAAAPKDPRLSLATLALDEARLVKAAETDLAKAYAEALAPEGRIMGLEDQPAVGREAYAAALARRPARASMKTLACETASSGELGVCYGTARWTGTDGKAAQGVYMRVWQLRDGDWKILADNLTADR